MSTHRDGKPTRYGTGVESFKRCQELAKVEYEIHTEVLAVTLRSRADIPVPSEWKTWADDLRRGRLSVGGGFIRLVQTMIKRDMPEGRTVALRVLDLLRRYVDIALPANTQGDGYTIQSISQRALSAPVKSSYHVGKSRGMLQVSGG